VDIDGGSAVDGVSVISCDECVMQHTSACDDCVVTFICSREPDEAVVIDAAQARAVRMLGEAGLVPHLRQIRRTG
jgi:Zn-finger protein